uniref:Uncharacterized protein n=1 Tax=Vespula pensylvanica TaxID=30213 RepID=A0A834PGU0_VESPE|nr:hypothetical protein H0235_001332 [Vespula pensylvanica]
MIKLVEVERSGAGRGGQWLSEGPEGPSLTRGERKVGKPSDFCGREGEGMEERWWSGNVVGRGLPRK